MQDITRRSATGDLDVQLCCALARSLASTRDYCTRMIGSEKFSSLSLSRQMRAILTLRMTLVGQPARECKPLLLAVQLLSAGLDQASADNGLMHMEPLEIPLLAGVLRDLGVESKALPIICADMAVALNTEVPTRDPHLHLLKSMLARLGDGQAGDVWTLTLPEGLSFLDLLRSSDSVIAEVLAQILAGTYGGEKPALMGGRSRLLLAEILPVWAADALGQYKIGLGCLLLRCMLNLSLQDHAVYESGLRFLLCQQGPWGSFGPTSTLSTSGVNVSADPAAASLDLTYLATAVFAERLFPSFRLLDCVWTPPVRDASELSFVKLVYR